VNPAVQWALGTAVLWLIVAGLAVSQFRTWLRDRRADARIRERVRTADPQDLAEWTIPASQRSGQ
jgi:hypothetical protein